MNNPLERIQIIGLHGNATWDVKIRDNTLVLVGENGSGKTTFLRILFYFLSGRWSSLNQFRFEDIIATINGIEYKLTHTDLEDYHDIYPPCLITNYWDKPLKEIIDSKFNEFSIWNTESNKLKNQKYQILILDSHSKSKKHFGLGCDPDEKKKKKISEIIKNIRKAIPAQILYLPTYRRIERELSAIFEGMDPEGLRHEKDGRCLNENDEGFTEFVEFGMKDVQNAIDRELANLKEFARENLNSLTLGYLGDVVDREYRNVTTKEIANVSDETVRSVLNRIDESILNETQRTI